MMRSEFLEEIRKIYDETGESREDPTVEEYRDIETVYAFHPSIPNVGGKRMIAELYVNCGMTLIYDMLRRAEAIEEAEKEVKRAKEEYSRLVKDRECLKCGKLPEEGAK